MRTMVGIVIGVAILAGTIAAWRQGVLADALEKGRQLVRNQSEAVRRRDTAKPLGEAAPPRAQPTTPVRAAGGCTLRQQRSLQRPEADRREPAGEAEGENASAPTESAWDKQLARLEKIAR